MLRYNPMALKEARLKAGLTQQEVAKNLRVSPQRVQQLESEGAPWPTISTLLKVWGVLDVTDPCPFFVLDISVSKEINSEIFNDNKS